MSVTEVQVSRKSYAAEMVAFDEMAQRIAEYKEKNACLVFNYEDPKGEKEARSHIHGLRQVKGRIAAIHQEVKADALALCKAIDAKKNQLTSDVDEMINVHLNPLKQIENRRLAEAAAKAEAERLEKERLEKERLEAIRKQEEEIARKAAELAAKEEEAKRAERERIAKIKAEEERIKREREQFEADKRAEEEARRREEQARVRAEQEKQAAIERIEREKKEALERAEREKQAAIEAEREKARLEAEAKAKAEEERERVRLEAEAEEKRKAAERAEIERKRIANQRHRESIELQILNQIDAILRDIDRSAALLDAIKNGQISKLAIVY